jgi:transposase
MRDVELYRHLLGLQTPWTVSRVTMDIKEQRVDVFAEHGSQAKWLCPQCEVLCPLHDHEAERQWRHLDSCQFRTILHARVPRVTCEQHGIGRVRVPWAEPFARFTTLFERLAIDVLLETSVSAGARLLGLSWDEAQHIMERAVKRGLARRPHQPPRQMGVDEKAIGAGQSYATLVYNVETSHVVEMSRGRSKAALLDCLGSYTPKQMAQVEVVALDMCRPYIQLLHEVLPDAQTKLVFDPFHIVAHMSKAVDQTRREENKILQPQGNKSLVGTKYMWLYGEENLPEKYQVDFEVLRQSTLKTARAWAIKESLRGLWDCDELEEGQRWWKQWYFWATHSRLEPVKKVAKMIKRHLDGVMNYFLHPITNAVSEGLNSTIQLLKQRARGYRNFANLRVAVLFHCGGLQLYPQGAEEGVLTVCPS